MTCSEHTSRPVFAYPELEQKFWIASVISMYFKRNPFIGKLHLLHSKISLFSGQVPPSLACRNAPLGFATQKTPLLLWRARGLTRYHACAISNNKLKARVIWPHRCFPLFFIYIQYIFVLIPTTCNYTAALVVAPLWFLPGCLAMWVKTLEARHFFFSFSLNFALVIHITTVITLWKLHCLAAREQDLVLILLSAQEDRE